MNLYLIKRTDDVDYEENEGHVVVAANPDQARELVSDAGAEGSTVWLSARTSTVSKIGTTTRKTPTILLTSNRGS